MKKLFVVLIGLMIVAMIVSSSYADVNNRILDRTFTVAAEVEDSGILTKDFDRIAIFVDYDETGAGNDVDISFEASRDNVNYVGIPFFDTAGGVTPQTSETITADGTSLMWFDRNLSFPYLKVEITSSIVSGQIDIEAYITGQK